MAHAREEFRLGLARGLGAAAREFELAGAHALRLIGADEQEPERIAGRCRHAAAGREHHGPFDRGPIARPLRRAGAGARRAHGGDGQRDAEARAVLADIRPVAHLVAEAVGDRGDRVAPGHRSLELVRELLGALREFVGVVDAQRARRAEQFRRAVAQHLLGPAVEQAHHVVGIDGDDRHLRGGIQQGLQLGLRVARGALLILRAIEQAAQLGPQRVDLLAAKVDVGLARLVVDEIGGGADQLPIAAGLALRETQRDRDDDDQHHQHRDADDAGELLHGREQRVARLRDQHVPAGGGRGRHGGQPALVVQRDLARAGVAVQRAVHEIHVAQAGLRAGQLPLGMHDHPAQAVEHDHGHVARVAGQVDLMRHLVERQVGNHDPAVGRCRDHGGDVARQRRQEGIGPDRCRGHACALVERALRQILALPVPRSEACAGPHLRDRHDARLVEQHRRLERLRLVQCLAERRADLGLGRARAHVRGRARGGLAGRCDQQLHLRAHQQRGALVLGLDVAQRLRDGDGAPQHDHQQQRHAREQHVLAREDALEGLAHGLHGTRRVTTATSRNARG